MKLRLCVSLILLGPCAFGTELPRRHEAVLRAIASELELQTVRTEVDPSLWVKLGVVRTELGELEPARAAFERARELRPGDPELRAHQAYVLFLGGEADRGRRELDDLLEGFPDNAMAVYYRGVAESVTGEVEGAAAFFERAGQLKPDDPRIALARLRIQRERRSPAELVSSFRQLYLRAPDDFQIEYAYGELLLDSGDSIAAISVARALTEQHPDWAPGQKLLARAYWKADDILHTVFVLERLPADELSAELCLTLAQAKERLQLHEDSARYLEIALERSPDFLPAQRALAFFHLRFGQDSTADAILRSILARFPDDYDALYLSARLWKSNGELDRAVDTLTRLATRDPSRYEAFEELGDAYMTRGDARSAVRYFREALELHRDSVWLNEQLGLAFARLDEHDTALRYFRRAVELAPPRPESHYLLGRALLRLGRIEAGKRELRMSQELSREQRGRRKGGMGLTRPVRP